MSEIHEIDHDYSIEVISEFNEFCKLRDTWNTLAKMQESYQPWFMFEWFNLSLTYFSNNSQLFILLLYRNRQLVTVAPLAIVRENYKGIINVNKLELIGNIYSPVRNFLFRDLSDESRKICMSYIIKFLSEKYKEWTILELDSIPTEDNSCKILKLSLEESKFNYREYFCFKNFYIDDINYPGDAYLRSRPRNARQNFGKYKRRLEKMGTRNFQVGKFEDQFDCLIDKYYLLRDKSWKAPDAHIAFHKDFWRIAARNRWLRCALLILNGSPIASLLYLVYERYAYLMEANYDLAYSKFSPGAVLLGEVAMHVIDVDNVTEINAGRGDEDYKKRWFPQERDRRGICVFNKDLKGQALSMLMTTILPFSEKNQYLLSAKNKLSRCFKKHPQQ